MFNIFYSLLKLHKRTLVFYIVLFILPLILILTYLFTAQPFRNDTDKYLNVKTTLKTTIMSQKTEEATKQALIIANKDLGGVRCDKVNSIYQVECDRLKTNINQLLPLIESSSKSAQANYLANDIVNLLK